MKKFYAVQNGTDYSSDYGSTVKREALRMARRLMKNEAHDGEEIRICVCTTESDDCLDEIILREGKNGWNA